MPAQKGLMKHVGCYEDNFVLQFLIEDVMRGSYNGSS